MTWHNQIVILKQQLQQLAAVIGSGLIQAIKPFVIQMNTALSGLISFAQNVVNALGKIFGWELEVNTKGLTIDDEALDDGADAMGNLGDAADDAAKATKELNKQLQGFDKLNVLTTQKDKSKNNNNGKTTAVNPDMAINNDDVTAGLKKTKGLFESEIDNLFDLGRYINKKLTDLLNSIDWEIIYRKAREVASGLASFLNGLISPELFAAIGRTIVNGLNTIAHFLDEFAKKFDFENLGKSIAAGINAFFGGFDWNTILSAARRWGAGIATTINNAVAETDFYEIGRTVVKSLETALTFALTLGSGLNFKDIGAKLADGINGAIENFPAKKFADTIDVWVQGIFDLLVSCLDNIHWNDLVDKIKEFISNLDFKTVRILLTSLAILKGASLTISLSKAITDEVAKIFVKGIAKSLAGKMAGSTILKKAIGDGLGEAAKGAGGAEVGEATAGGALAGLVKFLGGVGMLLGGATLAVSQFVGEWNHGFRVIAEVLKWVGLVVAAVGAVILGVPVEIAAAVAAWVGSVAGIIIMVKDNWEQISSYLINAFNHLKEIASGVFTAIGNIIQVALMAIGQIMKGAFDIITLPWRFMWENGVKGVLIPILKTIQNTIKSVFTAISTIIKSILNVIFNSIIKPIFTAIQNTITQAVNVIKTIIQVGFNVVKNNIITPVTNAYKSVVDIFTNMQKSTTDKANNLVNQIKTVFNKVIDVITSPFRKAKDSVKTIISSIKDALDFTWDLPDLKMPHPYVSGSFSLNPPSVPTFGIRWYKKAYNNPFIFNSATVLPTSSGLKGFGDGNGGELVYGHSSLMEDIRNASGSSQMSAIGNRQLANDQRIIQLLTVIAEKEFGISQDAVFRAVRNGASDYTMRTGRGAFEF